MVLCYPIYSEAISHTNIRGEIIELGGIIFLEQSSGIMEGYKLKNQRSHVFAKR